ncbi:MAG: hypothetical protein IJ017_05910 [Oscillospiraceae bacterium]|nr:hypothetical protein [Oscillospiraceae bacterium]
MDLSDFKAKDAYKAVFTPSRLLHSYLICGEDGEDKSALINTLAAAMICESGEKAPCGVCRSCKKSLRGLHPDIIHVAPPEGKREIPIDMVRDVRSEAVVLPNEADRKVFIIEQADLMKEAAQNAFLKTLEEPPRHARFILSAENPAGLLDTVRSRCAELRVRTENPETDVFSKELAQNFFTALRQGGLVLAEFTYTLEKLDRDKMLMFIAASKEETLNRMKKGKLKSQTAGKILAVLEKCSEHMKFNVNVGHIAGMICAELIG